MKVTNHSICVENIPKGNIKHPLLTSFSCLFHIYILYVYGLRISSQNDTVLLENGD